MSGSAPRTLWLDRVDSTNAVARGRALEGERGPLWIASRQQTAGRGRRGRPWAGLDGNLFTTGLFTLNAAPARAAELSFAAALAVADVCDEALRDPDRIKLKWPNDVELDGRKLAGILLESGEAPGGGLWLAVGIGVNLAAAPESVERPAIALNNAGGDVSREVALEQLAAAFQRWLERWLRDGFGPLRDHWLMRAKGLGERCEARLADEHVTGIFGDLGPDGALRLDMAGGARRYITAGDVFFPDS